MRFKISWRRSGILLIHAGIVIMMLSELVTGLFAIEGNMRVIGLARDDSRAPASYYSGVDGAPVPATSVGYHGTVGATLWF